ncbi:MAG TPA: DUF1800 domain-containing protein, partial [Fimbriimonas sp.]|nr:DUF1800 domain-containing protein [Fimbriimonas sp.]
YSRNGLKGAIDQLLDPESIPEVHDLSWVELQNDKGVINPPQASIWFAARLLITRRPMVEKMSLYWHNHFATSAEKVTAGPLIASQIDIFRRNALGNFKTLLTEVSKDPAMLIWLDGQDNIKGRANENFAREILELFTLGEGNYTEKDVQEAARAFTGWSFVRNRRGDKRAPAEYQFKPVLHDAGPKTVLGKSGNLTGDDVISVICSMPRTAEFVVTKIWNWFVYPNPSKKVLEEHIDAFWRSGLDIKTLMRSIMNDEEFYSERAYRRLVKNPADYCISTLRAMGVGEIMAEGLRQAAEADDAAKRGKVQAAAGCASSMKTQGMWLLYPPDVSGWKPGNAWITSATMVERIAWANKVTGQASRGVARYPMFAVLSPDPTPLGIAQKLCSLYDAPLSQVQMQTLAKAAEASLAGKPLTNANANKVASDVLRLIFGSPEFQFC